MTDDYDGNENDKSNGNYNDNVSLLAGVFNLNIL